MTTTMSIGSILDRVEVREYTLPEFQRDFVWTDEKIERFYYSLYRGYPVGGLITWRTNQYSSAARSETRENVSPITFILDGQQRVTALYSICKGRPPEFYEGDPTRFDNFYFDLDRETFRFYSPQTARENQRLILVSEIFQHGEDYYDSQMDQLGYSNKDVRLLSKIINLLTKNLYFNELAGEQYKLGTVIEVFNEVNRGGTPLSVAYLTLSKIYPIWPECRNTLTKLQEKLHVWRIRVELLLRSMTVVTTQNWSYSSLDFNQVTKKQLEDSYKRTETILIQILDLIKSHLGIDSSNVLRSHNSLPIMLHFLNKFRNHNITTAGFVRLLGWYLHTVFWRRYPGKNDNFFQRDLNLVNEAADWNSCLDSMYELLRLDHGPLHFNPEHFDVSQVNSVYYPIIYILMRTGNAIDLGNRRIRLSTSISEPLHKHHIFPKKHLQQYSRKEVNALANFAFITRSSNLSISANLPSDYLAEIEVKVLESQWIPVDQKLWEIKNYPKFLSERRKLLSAAANKLLENLESGKLPHA